MAAHALARESGSELWLVGGTLRDIALGVERGPDVDFVVGGVAAEVFSRELAKLLGGTSFLLDADTDAYRVVVKQGGHAAPAQGELTVDVSAVKGTVYEDLAERDFTVNAMAVDVASLYGREPVVPLDPFGGMSDAGLRVLRAVSTGIIEADPVRALRAVRIAQGSAMEIDGDTARLIIANRMLAANSSVERVRDELAMIFSRPGTSWSIRKLFELGLVDAVLPAFSTWVEVDGYRLLDHTLRTVDEAEKIIEEAEGPGPGTFAQIHGEVRDYLRSRTGALENSTLLKLAAFVHDAGKPLTLSRESGRLRFIGHDNEGALIVKQALGRLKFSRKVIKEITCVVKNHHRLFMLSKLEKASARAKANFFRSVGGTAGVTLALVSLADARATTGTDAPALTAFVLEMLSLYFRSYSVKRPEPLLSGRDIIKTFAVEEGPVVGELLRLVSDGIDAGRISTRRQAVELISAWLEEKTHSG